MNIFQRQLHNILVDADIQGIARGVLQFDRHLVDCASPSQRNGGLLRQHNAKQRVRILRCGSARHGLHRQGLGRGAGRSRVRRLIHMQKIRSGQPEALGDLDVKLSRGENRAEREVISANVQAAKVIATDLLSRFIEYPSDCVKGGRFNMGGYGGGGREYQLKNVTIRSYLKDQSKGIIPRQEPDCRAAKRHRTGIGAVGRVLRPMNMKGVGSRILPQNCGTSQPSPL